jgi:hypothetical protein
MYSTFKHRIIHWSLLISGRADQHLSCTSITTSFPDQVSLEMVSEPSPMEYCNDRRASDVARRNSYSADDPTVYHINHQQQMTEYGRFAVEIHHEPQDEPPKRTEHRQRLLSRVFGWLGRRNTKNSPNTNINSSRGNSVTSTTCSLSEIPSPPLSPMQNNGPYNDIRGRVIEDVGIPNRILN